MTITIRTAAANDEAAIVALWQACGLVTAYNDPTVDLRFALAGPASAVLVAQEAAGRLCGSVMVGHDGHRGWIYYVAAAPHARGQGVGRGMIAAAEDWLRARRVAKVQLMVRSTNAAVVPFYERLGYEETPRILMSKWLDRPAG